MVNYGFDSNIRQDLIKSQWCKLMNFQKCLDSTNNHSILSSTYFLQIANRNKGFL